MIERLWILSQKLQKFSYRLYLRKRLIKVWKRFFQFSIFLKLLIIEVRKSVYVQGFWRSLNVLLNKIKVTWAKLIYSFHSFLQWVYNWSYLAYLYTFRLQLKFSLYMKLLYFWFFVAFSRYRHISLNSRIIIWLTDIRNLPNECGWNKQIKSESFRFKDATHIVSFM